MKVCVVGGGLAGLAAACELADLGYEVTLLERRPWLGGKAYSFVDDETGAAVDNGQHVFLECTPAYRDFLRKLGTLHLTKRQERLRMPVFDADGRRSDLSAAPLPVPLHALPSFLRYRHLSWHDKLSVARTMVAIHRLPSPLPFDLMNVTFADWLRRRGASGTAIRNFWDLIVIPTLNCRSDEAAADQALFVFKEGLLQSSRSAAVGIPVAGLSELHAEPARRYIEERGRIETRAGVDAIEVEGGLVTAVVVGGERRSFDRYVSALPPRQLYDLLPQEWQSQPPFSSLAAFETAPIVNLHLWYDGPVADFDFAAFTGCDLQWLFNRSRIAGETDGREHLVVSLSAAERYVEMDKRQLLALLLPQIERALPAARGRHVVQSILIKEPDATFKPLPGVLRPGPKTPLTNLFLAGAYTDTGWPATMESAVRSGNKAAAALHAAYG
jgi:squalene-associated FAD-dependent desaturase